MSNSTGNLCVAAALWLGLCCQVSAQDLLREMQPGRDDWEIEKLQTAAGKKLAALAEIMEGIAMDRKGGALQPSDLSAIFTREARSAALRPREVTFASHSPEVRVARGGASAELVSGVSEALSRFLQPVRGGQDLRIKFKIRGATLGEGGVLETLVRLETSCLRSGGAVQQTCRWRVTWAPGSLRISSIRRDSYQELTSNGPMFTECTAGVLGNTGSWIPHLQRGGEYWNGRIDAVGELNLMGHQGIAVADINGDGLEDLYVAMGTGLPNRLFLQQKDGSVRDVAVDAGVAWLDDTKGVVFADMDNDGDQDLLCAIGPTIVLCKNSGQGQFRRFVSMRARTPAAFYSLSVGDFDLDGDLDVYGCRYVSVRYGVSVPLPFHDARNGPTNHLMRNDGNDKYTDVTFRVGLEVNNTCFSLAAAWMDYDSDGDPDLYVANDFGRNNLYRNDGGKFTDVAAEAGVEDQAAGMGVSWGDFDLDGDPDLYVTNMFSAAGNRIAFQSRFQKGASAADLEAIRGHSLGNSLFQNQGDGTFREVGEQAGIRMGRWGWGARFVDLDNDGRDDIVAPNGFLTGRVKDDL